MRRKIDVRPLEQHYWRFPEKGFPRKIYWKTIVPENAKLSEIQKYDLVYDQKDLRMRQIKNIGDIFEV